MIATENAQETENKRVYKAPQLATRWGTTVNTVIELCRSGQLEAIDIGAGSRSQFRITADALQRFEDSRRGGRRQ